MPEIKDVKYFVSSYLPNWTVWGLHIVIAVIFFILGGMYLGYKEHEKEGLTTIGEAMAWIIIIFGILMITYHSDLLLMYVRQ